MTITASTIDTTGLDVTFPVTGIDNNTQGFRDNFDSIKLALDTTKIELNDILASAARTTVDNNFELHIIENAILQQVREQRLVGGYYTSGQNIDWQQGSYQTWIISNNVDMAFTNLPGDISYIHESTPLGWGKVTLELYGDGTQRNITFTTSGGAVIKADWGTWDRTVTSTISPVIVEAWRHSHELIFIRYVGTFA